MIDEVCARSRDDREIGTSMAWTLKQFTDNQALVTQLVTEISTLLQTAIKRRGKASMAVSGGSTPKALFMALSQQQLLWEKITITLVDERWVAETDSASNALLVRQTLLQNLASTAGFVSFKNAAADPFSGSAETEMRLRQKVLPLDIALLGMGDDGHTASFFPGASELADALALDGSQVCCGITPPQAPWPRLTLTLPAVLAAEKRILYLIGRNKLPILEKAMQPGPVAELPVRAVLHQPEHHIDIYYAEAENRV